jgi:sialic acid synthase SpsE
MSDLIIYEKTAPPEIPEKWDYNESVKKVKGQIYKIRFMTTETVGEIWIANHFLDGKGRPEIIDKLSLNSQKLVSFSQYCQEIGVTTFGTWCKCTNI